MKRIDTPDNRFHNGDPATQTRGTVIAAWWLNAVQEEICNVITSLGQELNPEQADQMAQALLAAFAPKSHQQGWNTITDKPDAYPPAAHQQGWNTITGKPSAYPPEAHQQAWSTITGKPTTFPPSNHGHSAGEISGLSQVPTGAIIIWPDDDVPSGFLECNGAACGRSSYSRLYGIIGTRYGTGNGSSTFNVPNLRHEFIRGWDGSTINCKQDESFKTHYHRMLAFAVGGGGDATTIAEGGNWAPAGRGTGGSTLAYRTNAEGGRHLIESAGGAETRPRNVSMMFCIKY